MLLEQEILKINSELEEIDCQNKEDLNKNEADIESKGVIYCSMGVDKKLHKSNNVDYKFKVFDIDGDMAKF